MQIIPFNSVKRNLFQWNWRETYVKQKLLAKTKLSLARNTESHSASPPKLYINQQQGVTKHLINNTDCVPPNRNYISAH